MRSPLAIAAMSFAATGAALLLSPASAEARGASQDYRCTALAEQVRTAAANHGNAAELRRVNRMLRTGEALCEARAEGEAARQFRSALAVMNVAEVRPSTTPEQVAAR